MFVSGDEGSVKGALEVGTEDAPLTPLIVLLTAVAGAKCPSPLPLAAQFSPSGPPTLSPSVCLTAFLYGSLCPLGAKAPYETPSHPDHFALLGNRWPSGGFGSWIMRAPPRSQDIRFCKSHLEGIFPCISCVQKNICWGCGARVPLFLLAPPFPSNGQHFL